MTKIRRGEDGRPKFVWVVELEVSRTWVEDGYDLTQKRVEDMLRKNLQYAYDSEFSANILAAPNPEMITKAQGYYSAFEAGLDKAETAR